MGVSLLAVSCVGTVLAGCSSSTSSPTTTTRHTTTTTTARRPTTTTTSSSTSSSTQAGGTRPCAASDLVGSVSSGGGAAGTIESTIELQNRAGTPCVLEGYPGLQLLGPGATPLPTSVVRKGSYPFTAMGPTLVTLTASQAALFNLGYSDVPVGNETHCPTATSLEVTPPNATDHLVVTANLSPCGGGTVVVSPVFAAGTETESTV